MEDSLHNKNQEEYSSRFLKWKWWRPLYYVYFAGMVAAVVLLYSGQKHGRAAASAGSAVEINEGTTPSSSQQLTETASPAQPREVATENSQPSRYSAEVPKDTEPATLQPKPVGENMPAATTSETSETSSSSSKYAFMMSPSEETVENGKSLYMDDCVACHGANGEGDGPAAVALKPKPRDFHSSKGWINGRMASGMFKTLTYGITGSAMPPFSTISVKERLDIISYIRSFKGFPRETKADVELLTKMIDKSGGSGQGDD